MSCLSSPQLPLRRGDGKADGAMGSSLKRNPPLTLEMRKTRRMRKKKERARRKMRRNPKPWTHNANRKRKP